MSDYTVIANVGETLKTLLWDNIESDARLNPEIIASKNEITLASPDKLGAENATRLSLYLYRVIENPFMKNREMQNGFHPETTTTDVPLTLDLFYLITPDTGDVEKDHILLGKTMQVFYDNGIVSGSVLEGDALKGTAEKLRIQLYSLPFEEIINLWQSFSEKSFLLSTCYQVTPVSIDAVPREETQRVVEKKDDYNGAAAQRRTDNA
ncbi:MAG: DUF4255 domain-containing protein [bacterium]|nr:DUF4255 domain-containing protein [bacterium]